MNQPRLVPTPATLAVAVALAVSGGLFLPQDSYAAGLGRLTVQSALGQPLQAEVEITSLSQEESSSLVARLATPEAFRQAGLEYNPALTGLNFQIDRRSDGRAVVRISSNRPINEPFVDLLVELNWASGKFAREYTFLLDPPELQVGRANTVEGGTIAAAPVAPRVGVADSTPMSAPAARAQAPAPVASAPTAPAPAAAAPMPAPVAQAPAAVPPARPPMSAAPTPARPSSIEVGRGDILADIAERVRPEGVSLNQAIVSIYRANPGAFFGGVHQMRSGVTLAIPSESEMRSLSSAEVATEMRASLQAFNEYRNRIASAAPEVGGQQGGQLATGTIGQAQAPAEAPVAGDQLRLSTGDTGAGVAGAATGSQLAESAEASVARDNALREAQSRVDELEKNVTDLQRLLELKNRQLADLEQQLTQARQAGTGASGTISTPSGADVAAIGSGLAATGEAGAGVTGEPATGAAEAAGGETAAASAGEAGTSAGAEPATGTSAEPATGEMAAGEMAAGETATEASGGDATTGADPALAGTSGAPGESDRPALAAGDTQASDAAGESAGQPAGTMAGTDTPAPAQPVTAVPAPAAEAPAPTPAAAPVAAVEPPAPTPAPSFLDELRENPYVLLGGGALILLGGFYMWYSRRRRKSAESFEDSLGGTDAFTANSLFGTTGGQNVDTANSLFSTNIRDSGVDVHSTEVDPIAEAEVYIAYGREAQAEEILKEALKKQPERHAIRSKLLEIHAGRKDVASFNELAREMYEQAGGTNEEWPKVVTLGLSIDPENPLYTGRDDGDGGHSAGIAAAGVAGAAGLIEALDSPPDAADDEPQARAESEAIGDLDFSIPGDTQDSFAATTAAPEDTGVDSLDDNGLDFSIDIDSRIGDTEQASSSLDEDAIADVDLPSLDLGDPVAPA
ncbi:MAG: FimV/HubP family polar landmark protein, partial [Burkholderiaceae bacterium]